MERLQLENDHLWAQVEERRNLGEKSAQDNEQAKHPTVRDKGKKPIVPDNINTLADDELSLDSSQNPSRVKSDRARSR